MGREPVVRNPKTKSRSAAKRKAKRKASARKLTSLVARKRAKLEETRRRGKSISYGRKTGSRRRIRRARRKSRAR